MKVGCEFLGTIVLIFIFDDKQINVYFSKTTTGNPHGSISVISKQKRIGNAFLKISHDRK